MRPEWGAGGGQGLEEVDPAGPGAARARAAPPGVLVEALSEGQALAAGPHTLLGRRRCAGGAGGGEPGEVRGGARASPALFDGSTWTHLQLIPGLFGDQ